MQTFAQLAGESTGTARRRSYQGKPVVIIDVVMLEAGIVVEGMLSNGPEYVDARALADSPQTFNGRPVLVAHPPDGAGSPEVWSESFGQVWNARFEDNALLCEAWLDPERAELVGDEAVSAINRVLAGEVLEVSIGAWIVLTRESGISPSGERYEYRWQNLTCGDHLAVSLETQGGRGACSVEKHRCGGNRTMSQHTALCQCQQRHDADNDDLDLSAFTAPDPWGAPALHAALNRGWRHMAEQDVVEDDVVDERCLPPNPWNVPLPLATALGCRPPKPPSPLVTKTAGLSAAQIAALPPNPWGSELDHVAVDLGYRPAK